MKKIPLFSPIIEKMIEQISMKKFNLTNFQKIETNKMTFEVGSGFSSNLNLATNNDNTVFKLYGNISCYNFVGDSTKTIATIKFETPLRPSEKITIFGGTFTYMTTNNANMNRMFARDLIIDVSGEVTITYFCSYSGPLLTIYLPPCLYFLK